MRKGQILEGADEMLRTEIVHLTPEIAETWKLKNINNFRAIQRATVERYANEMRSGNWQLNGEPITFYKDGTLANGQHRIEAVILSGMAIDTVVVYGVENDIKVYDSGYIRSKIQIARAMGMKANNPKLATAAFIYESGETLNRGKVETIEYYAQYQEYFDEAYRYVNLGVDRAKVMIKVGCIAAVYCAMILKATSREKLEAFCRIVNSGMPYENYVIEPAVTLRNMLICRELGNTCGRYFMNKCFDITYNAIKRFNKQTKNKTRYRTDGDEYKTVIPKAKTVMEMMKEQEAGR